MAAIPPRRKFAEFLRSHLRRLSPEARVDVFRSTNADWAALLRSMRQALRPKGWLFLTWGRASCGRAARAVTGAGYAFEPRWSHPSLGGARLLPRHPGSSAAAVAEAERRVLEAVRLRRGCAARHGTLTPTPVPTPAPTPAQPQPSPNPKPKPDPTPNPTLSPTLSPTLTR